MFCTASVNWIGVLAATHGHDRFQTVERPPSTALDPTMLLFCRIISAFSLVALHRFDALLRTRYKWLNATSPPGLCCSQMFISSLVLFFLSICLPSSGSYFSISLFSVQMSVSPGFSSLFACYSLLFLPDSWTTQPRCVRVCAGAVLYKSQISSWGVSRETPSWINTFVGYSLWPSEDARITVYWVIIKSISPVLVWFSFFISVIYCGQHLQASKVGIFLLVVSLNSCQLHPNSMVSGFDIRKKIHNIHEISWNIIYSCTLRLYNQYTYVPVKYV